MKGELVGLMPTSVQSHICQRFTQSLLAPFHSSYRLFEAESSLIVTEETVFNQSQVKQIIELPLHTCLLMILFCNYFFDFPFPLLFQTVLC